jgi:two-component system nitrogen regulation response regulator GlnG
MTRLLVIDDRDQTIEMCHRHLPTFDYVTRCGRDVPCQVCELRDQGCRDKCAHDYFEAAETLSRLPTLPDLVVLDLHFAVPEERMLPEDKSALPAGEKARRSELQKLRRHQGVHILRRLRRDYPTLPVVMLTTTDTELSALPASDGTGGRDPMVYFCENEIVDSRTLAAEITRALGLHHELREGPVFWGKSPAMAELRRGLTLLARSPLPVLLEGETGTGKSFLAEHVIHPRSGAKGPFVVTDLSAIPASLLPAHLFGSRRGAFTGAITDQPGVFEQAHGGTLFLDEIANLDLDLQKQLLLVLERGEVQRLGEARPRPASVKLVAATNEDLGAVVAAGRFRGDLFMRLNPATRLRVPPLRERAEDIPELLRFAILEALGGEGLRPLVREYLARFPTPEDFDQSTNLVVFGRPRADRAPAGGFAVFVARGALDDLCRHPWTGNTRELRAFVSNALVFMLASHLETPAPKERAPAVLSLSEDVVARLLLREGPVRDSRVAGKRAQGFSAEVNVSPGKTLAAVSVEVERQYLTVLFHESGGDLERMALTLLGPQGTGRQVHLRLNQLGIGVRKLRQGDGR